MITYEELRQRGGHWLGAARSWIQTTFVNGETVVWGSDTILRGDVSPKKIEELAERVVFAYANKDAPEQAEHEQREKELELVLTVGHLELKPGRELVPVAVDEIKRLRKERQDAVRVIEEARVFAATVAQSTDTGEAGFSPSTGVQWRSRQEWAANVAKQLAEIFKSREAQKTDRLPNLPPEANARGGA